MAKRPNIVQLIAKNLKSHRAASGLSQDALAERAGLTRQTIISLEKGTGGATKVSTLTDIARALGIEGRDLLS